MQLKSTILALGLLLLTLLSLGSARVASVYNESPSLKTAELAYHPGQEPHCNDGSCTSRVLVEKRAGRGESIGKPKTGGGSGSGGSGSKRPAPDLPNTRHGPGVGSSSNTDTGRPAGFADGSDEAICWDRFTVAEAAGKIRLEHDDVLLFTVGPDAKTLRNKFASTMKDSKNVDLKHVTNVYANPAYTDAQNTYDFIHPDKLWVTAGIKSEKFAALASRRPKELHVLFSKADGDNLPDDSYWTHYEVNVATQEGTQVERIVRWDKDTALNKVKAGEDGVVIWSKGDAPLSHVPDYTIDPRKGGKP